MKSYIASGKADVRFGWKADVVFVPPDLTVPPEMERNFRFERGNELHIGSRMFDLKNCFRFEALKITPDFTALTFSPIPEWAPGEPAINLVFSEMTHLSFSPGFGTLPYLSDVAEIGFTEAWIESVEYLSDEPISETDHVFVAFAEYQHARIGAKRATAHLASGALRALP